jgi:alcohol dehydrogenase class IV
MPEQVILTARKNYMELDHYFAANAVRSLLLVCDDAFPFLEISKYFNKLPERMGIQVTLFNNFQPNPLYESVVNGVDVFHNNNCDLIVAVGGGSAMDVAKCIKLYSNMDKSKNYLTQKIVPNNVKLLVVPTTAGTGSEATQYAVIYYNGVKQSITDYSCIPSTVLMDASTLKTLPDYQKKSTMMDALCHAIESYWSVNSTEQSRAYSKQAITMILANRVAYLANQDAGNANMLKAAHIAGKAINITQTTAGHAMCYKLTSLYSIAHGHAAALCIRKLWPYMVKHVEQCVDPRGKEYVKQVFIEMACAFGCKEVETSIKWFGGLLDELALPIPKASNDDYQVLAASVNPVRLKNNPIALDTAAINKLYRQILSDE